METTLRNEKCVISFDEKNMKIHGDDLTDLNNMPAFISINKRGLKKAWLNLIEQFSKNTTMYGACDILYNYKIHTHTWCMMD